MTNKHANAPRLEHKTITCIVPDDGSDKEIMRSLLTEKKITQVTSNSCLGIAVLAEAKTKYGKLPHPVSVRKLVIVLPAEQADELFDFVYFKARLDEPKRGVIWLGGGDVSSMFALPADLELEY